MQINIDVKAIEAKALQIADRKCRTIAIKIQAEARRMIHEGPKTGKIYMVGKNEDRPHQASAPGEAPATDTGNLARHIDFVHIGVAHWRVISSAEYADLEFGRTVRNKPKKSKGGGVENEAKTREFGTHRIAPRPYMRPSAKKVADETGAKYSG